MDSKVGPLKLHTKYPTNMMQGVQGGGEDGSPQLQHPVQFHSSSMAAGKETSPFVDTLLLTATRYIQVEASMATTA